MLTRNRLLLCVLILALLLVACSLDNWDGLDRSSFQGTPTPMPTANVGTRQQWNETWRTR